MAAKISSKKSFYLFIIFFSVIIFSSIELSAQKLLQDKEFNVDSGKRLIVDTPTGDIMVRTWNEEKVSVKIYGNRKAEDKVHFEFEETEEGVEVKAEKPNSFFNWFNSIKLKYEILVPQKFDLKLKTSGGDILVSDVEGNNEINTSGGDIKLRNLTGELKGKTSGGDIELESLKETPKLVHQVVTLLCKKLEEIFLQELREEISKLCLPMVAWKQKHPEVI